MRTVQSGDLRQLVRAWAGDHSYAAPGRPRDVRAGARRGALDQRQLLAPAGIGGSFDVCDVAYADRS